MNQEVYDRLNELCHNVIGAAIEVHKELGPGLLDAVYSDCLTSELEQRGHQVERNVELPVYYKGNKTAGTFTINMLIDGELVVNVMAVDAVLPINESKLVTALKLSGNSLGLIINFNVPLLKDGVKRKIVNNEPHADSQVSAG